MVFENFLQEVRGDPYSSKIIHQKEVLNCFSSKEISARRTIEFFGALIVDTIEQFEAIQRIELNVIRKLTDSPAIT